MKLYLCSYRIQLPDALAGLLGRPLEGARTAVIPNAKDYYADRARAYKIGQVHDYLRSLGLVPETVDLREYDEGEKLLEKLRDFDLLWVMGGNTFCLRYEMQRSGFGDIVNELLQRVVYTGESAGAVVAGTDLRGIEPADVPEFAEKVIEEGLRLVPKFVLPHADSTDFAEANQVARSLHEPSEIIALNDNQAFVVDGGHTELLTAREPVQTQD